MLSDTFLLTSLSSLRDINGNFFKVTTDNAVYFSALELSCKRIRFVEEMTYLYDFNTGNNVVKKANKADYSSTMK
jgi:hypothetical protein